MKKLIVSFLAIMAIVLAVPANGEGVHGGGFRGGHGGGWGWGGGWIAPAVIGGVVACLKIKGYRRV